MPKTQLLALTAMIAVSALPSGCNRGKRGDSNPPLTLAPPTDPGTDDKPTQTPVPEAQKVQITASVIGLGDVLAGIKKVGESWMPGTAVDPAADAQAGLLAFGFGPGFLGNIDMEGQHVMFVAVPPGQAAPEDFTFAGSLAVVDGRKLIESTPQEFRPQPLGDGMWELNRDGQRLLFKESGKDLLLGYSTEDIDRASKLKQQIPADRTLRARATNIPTDQLDPVALLGLPPDNPLVKSVGGVLQELESVEIESDFGTKKHFSFIAGAKAPFHKLGLEPIGAPRAAATSLESRLPANPMFVSTMSWGDPKLLHTMMDKMVPLGQVPDGLRETAAKGMESAHALLDQVGNDVVVAAYVDAKGRATLVIAADVKDEAATRAGLRGVNEVMVKGVEMQKTMAGKNKDQAMDVAFRPDGFKAGKIKGDTLVITVPKAFEGELAEISPFMTKNKLETIALVSAGTAIVAIGAGAKPLVNDIARALGKSRKTSLAQHGGLARVRQSMGGCQICASGDPVAYFGLRLAMLRDGATDKAVSKQARTHLTALGKVGDDMGDPGFGVRVAKDDASVAVVVPQTLLFAPPASAETISDVGEFVSDPETWMAEQGKPSAEKPAEKTPPAKDPAAEPPRGFKGKKPPVAPKGEKPPAK